MVANCKLSVSKLELRSACSMEELLFASAGACFNFCLLIALMSLLQLSHVEKLLQTATFFFFFVEKLLSKCCTSCVSVSFSDSGPTLLLVGMFNLLVKNMQK